MPGSWISGWRPDLMGQSRPPWRHRDALHGLFGGRGHGWSERPEPSPLGAEPVQTHRQGLG